MDLLGLLGGSNLAGADGPDGLIGNDDLAPVGDLGLEGGDLVGDDVEGLAGLALLQALAATPYDADAVLRGVLGLGGHNLVALAKDGSSLRVAQDSPVDAAVLQVLDRDFTGEGAIGLVEDVLGGNANLLLRMFADEEEVQSRRGNDGL